MEYIRYILIFLFLLGILGIILSSVKKNNKFEKQSDRLEENKKNEISNFQLSLLYKKSEEFLTRNIGNKLKKIKNNEDTINPKKTFLNFRNSLFNLLKNTPENKGFGLIFIRLCLDGIAGIKYLLELKPLHTLAIIKAHFSFYANLLEILKKRASSPKKQDYYNTKSIVWDYFITNKKVHS